MTADNRTRQRRRLVRGRNADRIDKYYRLREVYPDLTFREFLLRRMYLDKSEWRELEP